VDGSDMNVACFTFATDPSQLRVLEWYKSKTGSKPFAEFTPGSGSMWFMAGATNSTYWHRVAPADDPKPTGLRVSITFRQSQRLREQ
jgi:hypothetical protein